METYIRQISHYRVIWCSGLQVINLRGSSRPPGGRPEARSRGVKKRSKRSNPPDPPANRTLPSPQLAAAASTLVHAFVVFRLDYCSAIYEGLPTCWLKCLDMVLRTAARLVGRIPRFGRVSGYI